MPSIASSILKRVQEQDRRDLGYELKFTEAEVIALALQQARLREEQSIPEGEFRRVGAFKYPAGIEELRWQRTKNIIQRVRPGVDEDPVYLEMLARQAASVEMILRQEYTSSPNPKAAALCDRVLLGTTGRLDPIEESRPAGDDFLVILSHGFLSFLYQTAKAVILSWRQVEPQPGSKYALSPLPEDIEYVLKNNPYPLELLFKTLWEYLFNGNPQSLLVMIPRHRLMRQHWS